MHFSNDSPISLVHSDAAFNIYGNEQLAVSSQTSDLPSVNLGFCHDIDAFRSQLSLRNGWFNPTIALLMALNILPIRIIVAPIELFHD